MKPDDRVARRARTRGGRRRPVPLSFDLFEERLLLATFTVNDTGDVGTGMGTSGTLRYVISLVNAAATPSTIDFAIGSGLHTITLGSDLTPITKPVTIDGDSQPGGAKPNTSVSGTNAVILIQLDLKGHQGLVFNSGSANSTVQGLSLFGGSTGVTIGDKNVTVAGDFLGIQADGKTVAANATGVSIAAGLTGVQIGSSTSLASRNLISGNSVSGVSAAGPASIQNNLIGPDASGLVAKPNQVGVAITGDSVTVGGTVSGASNTIAFNSGPAVTVDTGTTNPIQQNLIFDNGASLSQSGIVLTHNGNDSEPAPTISGVTSVPGRTAIQGSVMGNASGSHTYTIEFYASLAGDTIGTQVQAHQFLGSTTLTINGTATVPFFDNQLTTTVAAGAVVVATATSDANNTSPFSSNAALSDPLTVTTMADDGIGSLREAIKNANANAGMDIISFDITPSSSSYTITLGSKLPSITSPTLIDATTQPGYLGAPVVELDGHTNSVSGDGLKLDTGSDKSRIRGLDIYGFANGAAIDVVSSNDVIQGNYLGTDVTGTKAPSGNQEGILINGATGTQVGGLSTVGNLISGNDVGAVIEGAATGSMLQGNLIGTDITGKSGLPNTGDGIQLGASNNTIGGTGAAANTIAFNNGGAGVDVQSGKGNTITQNSIFANKNGILLASGANDNQPAPTLESVNSAGTSTTIQGTLPGFAASTPYVLEFFASVATDPTGGDQAHVFLGSATVTTLASGTTTFSETFTVSVATGQRVTATATSGSTAAKPNDTSAFAGSLLIANPFLVTNTNNSGSGSLEQAITNANAHPGTTPDVISFQIPTSDPGYSATTKTWTISLTSTLTKINVPVLLDGTSQSGYSGTPLIQIQGTSSLGDGLVLAGASSGSTIRGLDVYGFSGGAGIHVETSGNAVQSTYLGTNATGTASGLGNQNGLWIDNAGDNTIGGSSLGNLISGNTTTGVLISGSSATKNVIVGDRIGTDATGAAALANAGDGIQLSASNNTIGGTGAGANTIAFNTAYGVDVQSGIRDTVTQNSIFANKKSGIFLATGANDNQPAPSLQPVNSAGTSTTIQGTLPGFAASTPYVLEFFASVATDPTGGDQAHVFLGSATVTTLASGTTTFSETFTVSVATGQRVTATATSGLTAAKPNDTSAFASSVQVVNPFLVTTTKDDNTKTIQGSLRQAILNAEASPGTTPDAITFQIPVSDPGYSSTTKTWTISLAASLPTITVPVLLDGTSQPGYSGTPVVQIQGASSLGDGLELAKGSDGSTVRGLDLYDFGSGAGIHIESSGNVVQSTYLGTDATGTAKSLGNQIGLWIDNAGSNTIGSATLGNLISGNVTGVVISGANASKNVILGNLIGTDVTVRTASPTPVMGFSSACRTIRSAEQEPQRIPSPTTPHTEWTCNPARATRSPRTRSSTT